MEFIRELSHSLATKQDPRTKDLPIVSNPYFVMCALASYLYIVKNGRKWMEDRKPFELKQVIRCYNFSMMIFNAVFLYFGFSYLYQSPDYSYFCQGITRRTDKSTMTLLYAGYFYIFVRYLDFFDTFFFILRKKFSHVSALHVIHHTIVAFNASFWYRYAPEGQPTLGVFLNAFIHVIMYGYYLLATFPSLRPYLWWKRYLTQLQIIQFVLFIIHMSIPLFYECGFPVYLIHFAIVQTVLIMSLFINFYIHAYMKKATPAKTESSFTKEIVDINGNIMKPLAKKLQ